jgi:hypothetical protein
MNCIPYPDAADTSAVVNITGTATSLATPRNINGVPFDGTADITISGGTGGGLNYGTATIDFGAYPGSNEA